MNIRRPSAAGRRIFIRGSVALLRTADAANGRQTVRELVEEGERKTMDLVEEFETEGVP